MGKGRLEAFSDGVIAIIITIMVLELRPPEEASFTALAPLTPVFLSYVLSFVYLAIYWNNHHHLLQATKSVNGAILWANVHLLFWLSLIPFVTNWIGEAPMKSASAAAYGAVVLMAAVAHTILTYLIVRHDGLDSALGRATKRNVKGHISLACYVAAIPLAFVSPVISYVLYVTVAAIWFIPDRRIERVLEAK